MKKVGIKSKCGQDWSKMHPVQGGRFCDSCEKKVVDLSKMTPDEIGQLWLQKKGKICARIEPNKTFVAIPKFVVRPSPNWKKAVAMAITALGLQATASIISSDQYPKTEWQSTTGPPPVATAENDSLSDQYQPITVKGRVYSEVYGSTCNGAKVWISGTELSAVANRNGEFLIEIPSPYLGIDGLQLECTYQGFGGAVWVDATEVGTTEIEIRMVGEELLMEMGEMIVDDWEEDLEE